MSHVHMATSNITIMFIAKGRDLKETLPDFAQPSARSGQASLCMHTATDD
jgi:hypothetical protein